MKKSHLKQFFVFILATTCASISLANSHLSPLQFVSPPNGATFNCIATLQYPIKNYTGKKQRFTAESIILSQEEYASSYVQPGMGEGACVSYIGDFFTEYSIETGETCYVELVLEQINVEATPTNGEGKIVLDYNGRTPSQVDFIFATTPMVIDEQKGEVSAVVAKHKGAAYAQFDAQGSAGCLLTDSLSD